MNTISLLFTGTNTSRCLFFTAMLLLAMGACSKSDHAEPEEETEETVTVPYYTLHRVENYQATTNGDADAVPATVFFSLESKANIDLEYARSNRWDLAFGGLFNSFLSGNNGANTANFGYGTTSAGGILILEQAFDDVVDIPADADFKTGADLIGTDDAGDYGAGTGWYLYDFNGTRMGDGSYDTQHVAYAMSNSLTLNSGATTTPRTIVVRTAKGNYAKLRILSCYKDAFTIGEWSRDVPHMYFTFEYVLVPAGSTAFEIK